MKSQHSVEIELNTKRLVTFSSIPYVCGHSQPQSELIGNSISVTDGIQKQESSIFSSDNKSKVHYKIN